MCRLERIPIIAITRGSGEPAATNPYAAAVRAAGGAPLPVTPADTEAILADMDGFLNRVDGILFSGGVDIHPAAYPVPPVFPDADWPAVLSAHRMEVDPPRDSFEIPLARAACAAGKPLLGICRGFQLINVALGGQLILDLDPQWGHRTHADGSSARHTVVLQPHSLLSAAYARSGVIEVNSRHHQGVDRETLAPPLHVTAMTADETVIEGIELPGHPWAVGVQWHPERALDAECHARSRELFARFLAACRP